MLCENIITGGFMKKNDHIYETTICGECGYYEKFDYDLIEGKVRYFSGRDVNYIRPEPQVMGRQEYDYYPELDAIEEYETPPEMTDEEVADLNNTVNDLLKGLDL